MLLMISEALRRTGDKFSFTLAEQPENTAFGTRELVFESPLTVTGSYVFDGDAFLVEGQAQTVLKSQCARCTKQFSEPVAFTFEERFIKAADWQEDSDLYSFTGETLELTQAVMDNFYLSLPLISLCREDCRGLCPVCGCNRNETECACAQLRPNNAFAALESIAIADKEV